MKEFFERLFSFGRHRDERESRDRVGTFVDDHVLVGVHVMDIFVLAGFDADVHAVVLPKDETDTRE